MHCAKTILILLAAMPLLAADFSGESALEFTRKTVAFGPRPSGSPAIRKLQTWIRSQLKSFGCHVEDDRFTAATPSGPIEMSNLLCRFPGNSGKVVVFSGHYDTKNIPGIPFVGANDGGSSTGWLLEMARALSAQKRKHTVYLVFFDGEEAFRHYSESDGLFGSRHLANSWEADGTLERIIALINVDMIGDRDLTILDEYYSDDKLKALIRSTAARLGYSQQFPSRGGAILDDHVPFVEKKVPAVNLIDFRFGPDNSYWHTHRDTMDKLSPKSLEAVGKVLLEVLRELET